MNKYRRTTQKLELERDGLWHLGEEFVPMHQYKFRDGEEVQIEISPADAPTRDELIEGLKVAKEVIASVMAVMVEEGFPEAAKEIGDEAIQIPKILARCKEADHAD